jgi:hypothetical protein
VQRRPPLPRRTSQRPILALGALAAALAQSWLAAGAWAQSADTSPFNPSPTDPMQQESFRRTPAAGATRAPQPGGPAEAIPSGAGDTGFDTTGAARKKKAARRKPGAPRPPPLPPPPLPGPPQQVGGHTSAPQIAARASYADAYKPPDTPPRRPPPAAGDPFEPVGVRVGSFTLRPAIEVTRGFDSNPARVTNGTGSAFTEVSPALQLRSLWSRHSFGADLRSTYTSYDSIPSLDRPLVDGRTFSRIDLSRDTQIDSESRVFLSTDNPGSPNLQADLAKLPIYISYGSTIGLTQRFNRLELSLKGSLDNTRYQDSKLTDGTTASNRDRDYTQYGGRARASYELMPGVKPFVEFGADVRRHELQIDRNGLQRDSRSTTPTVGTSFELARRLTGEVSVGYETRRYDDPTLQELRGVVADASLVWIVSGLTTATFTARSRAEESIVAGVSGALRRDAGLQVDHAFRRWLIGTLRLGYGYDDYIGLGRTDTRTSLGAAINYKLNREFWLKGEYRYDRLRSNAAGVDYDASTVLFGLRVQR